MVLEFRAVRKAYGGLRPLRIEHLEIKAGQALALLGFDQAMAEVFTNLATGATAPDEGDVRVFGQSTAAIADADAWLASLDRFGIVSERAVLLGALTVLQNLAIPLTLQVDPLPGSVRAEVTRLAAEVGIEETELTRFVGALSSAVCLRVRFGRAEDVLDRQQHGRLPPAGIRSCSLPTGARCAARPR